MKTLQRLCVAVAVLALVATGCGGSGSDSTTKSAPVIKPSTSTAPAPDDGSLPAGRFRSEGLGFLNGMTVTTPGPGWTLVRDAPNELTLKPPDPSGAVIRFSKGLYPSSPKDELLTDSISPQKVVKVLQHNRLLVVSDPVRRELGAGFRALVVDVRVRPSAPRRLDFLAYKGVGAWAIHATRGSRLRVWITQIRQPFGLDSFTVVAETPHPVDYRRLVRVADRLLRTVTLPRGQGIHGAG